MVLTLHYFSWPTKRGHASSAADGGNQRKIKYICE